MKTILVVEDEEKLRRVIELQLKAAGFQVEQARTAEEALKFIDHADLILTDLRLPGMDGLQFIAKLRETLRRQTPAIILTGDISTTPG